MYYNYHAIAKKLIKEGKLRDYKIVDKYNHISPALLLEFDDKKHPIMPIREYRWDEYFQIINDMKNNN